MPVKGILVNIDWNSNHWQAPPMQNDLDNVNFGFVQQNQFSYTALNFGHLIYPPDNNGMFWANIPKFTNHYPRRAINDNFKICFIRSKNWNDGSHNLIGFYFEPIIFPQIQFRQANHTIYNIYNEVHMCSQTENIVRFEDYLPLNGIENNLYLENGELSRQGMNYMNRENVIFLLNAALNINLNQIGLGIKITQIINSL